MAYIHEHVVNDVRAVEYRLYPFSDIHWDANVGLSDFDEDAFVEYRDRAYSDPFGLFVGLGDWLTAFRTKVGNAIRGAMQDMTSKLAQDEMYRLLCDKFINKFMRRGFDRSRWIGLTECNHRWVFADGKTSTQYICSELGIPYLGEEALVRIKFTEHNTRNSGNHTREIYMVVRHSAGGGVSMPAALTKIRRELQPQYPQARIYLIGHLHGHLTDIDQPVFMMGTHPPIASVQKRIYAVCGGFQKSRVFGNAIVPDAGSKPLDNSTFAEQMMLRNYGSGSCVISLKISKHRYEGARSPSGQKRHLSVIDLSITK